MAKLHIYLIPGLGKRSNTPPGLTALWRAYGAQLHYYPINWRDKKETYLEKQKHLIEEIDELVEQGEEVGLVGYSAGASAAMNTYAEREDKILGVVCVCGKLRNPESMSRSLIRRNPVFSESIEKLTKSLETLSGPARSQTMSIHPLYDEVVPVKDTIIRGAREQVIPTIGHLISIVYALVFYPRKIIRFIKSPRPLN